MHTCFECETYTQRPEHVRCRVERLKLLHYLSRWHEKAHTRCRIRRSLQSMYLRNAKGLLRGSWEAWRWEVADSKSAKVRCASRRPAPFFACPMHTA